MRWPFRRKGTETKRDAAASAPAAARPRAREWVALKPLPPTFTSTAPLTTGPAPVLPPLPGARIPAIHPVPAAVGRVAGIATALPAQPVQPIHVAGDAAVPVLVHRPVVAQPSQQPQLTEAVEVYVGEPREPAVPYRAPGWLRLVPPWLSPAEPEFSPLSLPEPQRQPEMPLPAAVPTPARPEVEESAGQSATTEESAHEPPVVRRRPNLGQSRRRGLGAPLKGPPGEQLEPPSAERSTVEVQSAPPPSPPPLAAPPPAPPPVQERTEASEGGGTTEPPPAVGVSLVYRSAPGSRRPTTLARPVPQEDGQSHLGRVPGELASALRASHRVDVSDVPVRRGPAVTAEARARGARAFTRGGRVHLPDEAGASESTAARGLLAHELVHAVQQRALGPHLPAIDSPEGQALEAEAVQAEGWYGGNTTVEPAPLLHLPRAAYVSPAEAGTGHSGPTQLAPLTNAVNSSDSVSRPEVSRIAENSARQVIAEWRNPHVVGAETGADAGAGADARTADELAGLRRELKELQRPQQKNRTGDQLAEIDQQLQGDSDDDGWLESTLFGRRSNSTAVQTQLQRLRDNLLVQQRQEQREQQLKQQIEELRQQQRDEKRKQQIEERSQPGHGSGPGAGAAQQRPPQPHAQQRQQQQQQTQQQQQQNRLLEQLQLELQNMQGKQQQERMRDQLAEINQQLQGDSDDDGWLESALFGRRSNSAAVQTQLQRQRDNLLVERSQEHRKQHLTQRIQELSQLGHDQGSGQAEHADGWHGTPINVHDVDMDDLSNRLYDRIRTRLRQELLVDRERAGLLTDFR